MATNLIRKDITSANAHEAGMAMNCLANIVTPELARDLAPDVVTLLSHSQPYVRKRAVLVLYKIFLAFPDALRPAFPKLKEKLKDPDPSENLLLLNCFVAVVVVVVVVVTFFSFLLFFLRCCFCYC